LNYFITDLFNSFGRTYYLIYTFLEYAAFTFFLWSNIKNRKFKNFILALSFSFFLFQIVYFFAAPRKLLDSAPIGVETILILVYIFYFFYEQLKINTTTTIYNHPTFWIATGILIYLSGTFFFYILVNHLPAHEIQPYWFITYIFDIVKNIMMAIGMIIFISKAKSQAHSPKKIPYLDLN
jgi:hypothetical protein